MADHVYSTSVAAGMLHVSQATLRDWAKKAGLRSQDNPADLRERGWTEGELRHLANLHNRILGKPPAEPEPSRRMRQLEARVARLEAHLGLV